MIAIDTNILIYAHRRDSDFHATARACLNDLAGRRAQWAIPWPCVHEFLAIATHPRIYDPPTTMAQAIDQVKAWKESSSLVLLGEIDDYWAKLSELLLQGYISGPLVHDARVAAICLAHGIHELWTADRDFSRFPRLKKRNPLIDN